MVRAILFCLCIMVFNACHQERVTADLSEFVLKDGFTIDQVASEPLLDSPVAMTFDYDGSIWVVELPGYMRDIEGSDEEAPDGKIVHLIDTNGDQIMDHREVVKDGLVAPRALALVYNGLLYTEGTSLWWDNVEDDSEPELVDSLYVIGGNIEHQPNGLLYNLDNWIYSAKANARYRKLNGKWLKEATSFRGQWGITHDAKGRLFYNDNSNPLFGDFVPPNTLISNPYLKIEHSLHQNIAPDRRLFAIQPNDVNRGYLPNVLDSVGRVAHFTSACGPLIYLADGLGPEFHGDAFVCGPEANLVKRYKVHQEGAKIMAEQAYEDEEFLISTDDSFRPVNLYTGRDGALYILDLRKGVIQHRAYMTSYLREIILNKKLDEINGKGRIYKVYKEGIDVNATTPETIEEWIKLLSSENGAERIMAQKYIVSSGDTSLKNDLMEALVKSKDIGKVHILWTLEGLGLLDQDMLITLAKGLESQEVWFTLIQLIEESYLSIMADYLPKDPNPGLELLIASKFPKYLSTEDDLIAEASLNSMDKTAMQAVMNQRSTSSLVKQKARETLERMKNNDIQAPQLMTEFFKDNRTAGLDLYIKNCSSCHGLDGEGRDNLAPPIMQSEYVNGPSDQLILLLLHGLKGPVNVKGVTYDMNLVMPGIKDNDMLSDKDIADIIIFVRNSFSFADPRVDYRRVTALRELTADRTDMYTEEELLNWKAQ